MFDFCLHKFLLNKISSAFCWPEISQDLSRARRVIGNVGKNIHEQKSGQQMIWNHEVIQIEFGLSANRIELVCRMGGGLSFKFAMLRSEIKLNQTSICKEKFVFSTKPLSCDVKDSNKILDSQSTKFFQMLNRCNISSSSNSWFIKLPSQNSFWMSRLLEITSWIFFYILWV